MGLSYKLQLNEKSVENISKEPILKCRYVVILLGFLIGLLLSMHRTVMSVAIVAMVNNTAISHLSEAKSASCPRLITNVTEKENFHHLIKKEGEFIWSPQTQGYILGSYFVGYVITQLPAALLAERYGCKWFLFSASLITGVLTLLVPPMSSLNTFAVIAVQVLRGLTQGFIPPSSAILVSNWFPKTERAFVGTFMGSSTSLGTALGSVITGYLCASPGGWPISFYAGFIPPSRAILVCNWFPKTERAFVGTFMRSSTSLGTALESVITGYLCASPGGWQISFYAVGFAGLSLSICILLFFAENPKLHPRISKAELDFILSNQECTLNKKRPKLPWLSMLTSIPVHAFVLGFFGHTWAVSQFWTVQSTFLGTILHYPIAENGIFTALPFLLQFSTNQLGAWITLYMQKKNIFSVNFLRKFWTFLSGAGYSGCLLGMYFSGCNRTLSVIFSLASMGFIGFGMPGVLIVAADLTPTFAGSLNALVGTISYPSTFILPMLVGYLTDKMQIIEQWYKVFFITIGVVMVTKMIFIFFGSTDVQPWNFVEEENLQEKVEKRTENGEKDHKRDKDERVTRF